MVHLITNIILYKTCIWWYWCTYC